MSDGQRKFCPELPEQIKKRWRPSSRTLRVGQKGRVLDTNSIDLVFKCRVIQLGLRRGEIVFFVTKGVWVSLSSFSEQGRVNQRELKLGTERVGSRELGGLVIVPQP